MGYRVKRCARCKTLNEETMRYCARCGADLPDAVMLSDAAPVPAPTYARMPDTDASAPAKPIACRVVDVDIPFWSLVNLLVKVAIAAIPAMVVLTIYAVFVVMVLAAIGMGAG